MAVLARVAVFGHTSGVRDGASEYSGENGLKDRVCWTEIRALTPFPELLRCDSLVRDLRCAGRFMIV
jgi:hypothetical protein